MWPALGTVITSGGPWALVGLVVVSLIRGWLIPRTTHSDRIADYKAAVKALEATVAEQKQTIAILTAARLREPTQ